MAASFIAAVRPRAHAKKFRNNGYLSRLDRALTTARRLETDCPTDDPIAHAAIREWISAGEVAAVIVAARG